MMANSLELLHNGKRVYTSDKSGLRPLVWCIIECKDKYGSCTLYDKVVGLAAARLIAYSAMISKVITPLASKLAEEHLRTNKIKIDAGKVVDNILTKDRSDICPMEQRAMKMDNKAFFLELKKIFT